MNQDPQQGMQTTPSQTPVRSPEWFRPGREYYHDDHRLQQFKYNQLWQVFYILLDHGIKGPMKGTTSWTEQFIRWPVEEGGR